MGIGDVVDAIGDGIEHGVKTMGRGIGKVVDGEAHVVGDGLDAVGLHGAAEAVDGFGDSVADHWASRSVSCNWGRPRTRPSWCTATSARSTGRSDI